MWFLGFLNDFELLRKNNQIYLINLTNGDFSNYMMVEQ